jgi:hypothetical protein
MVGNADPQVGEVQEGEWLGLPLLLDVAPQTPPRPPIMVGNADPLR